jgi:hypothetical protein
MKRKIPKAIHLVLVLTLASSALAQFKDQTFGGGLSGGAIVAQAEKSSGLARAWGRGDIRFPLANMVFGEFGIGGG